MNKEFSIKRLEQVRDVFAFCCFSGMAFSDVYQLSREHLVKDNNGALWICSPHWLKTHLSLPYTGQHVSSVASESRTNRQSLSDRHSSSDYSTLGTTKDPFYGIHFKMDEVNMEFLTKEELEVLMNKEFSIKRLEQVRDRADKHP